MKRTLALIVILAILAAPLGAHAGSHHRLFLGTGEFDPGANWDGILTFDRADLINGNQSPDRLVDMGASGVNFGHMIYYVKSRDEMYVTSLFTDEIMVFSNASTMDGPQVASRTISGALTQLREPHGLWIDESRDILYVANRLPSTGLFSAVVAFNNASTVTGNTAPNRSISGNLTMLDQPFNVFVDEARDYLYIANANGADANRGIVIFHNASVVTGNAPPTRQIAGTATPFYSTHPTVHNVVLDLVRDQMYVANHQDEVYVFHNASTADGNIAADRTLSGFDNALGLFYLPDDDILYVSDGPGAVGVCSAAQQVKVFYNASTLSGAVGAAPDRNVQWAPENCQYYPPQPLAVDVTCVGGTRGRLRIGYGSGASDDRIKVTATTDAPAQPDPQTNGVDISLRFDVTTVGFGLPGGGDARWSRSDPARGKYIWDDPLGTIGGIRRYKVSRRSSGDYKIALSARDIDLASTTGAVTVDGEFDHESTADCSATPDMTCTATATRLKCRD